MTDPRVFAGQLARKFLQQDNPTGWFEALYAGANGDEAGIPWANLAPNSNFTTWLERHRLDGHGEPGLVIGCGLGDDAEELARLGLAVTAFDISTTAIDWCRQRFPNSQVDYRVADLFNPPAAWRNRFDFVLEAYTIQALPATIRQRAIEATAQLVAPGGTLLVICLGYDPSDLYEGPPWPLTRAELATFQKLGLQESLFEDYFDQDSTRRFRITYKVA